jgi:DNA processing protein
MTARISQARISEETKLDWLRLIRSEHVGPRTFRLLVTHYGGARGALKALPDLARRGGATAPGRICSRENAERELAAMEALGASFLAMGEPEYPYRLAMIDDAPPLLAVRANVATLKAPMVAIVGARNASAAGVRTIAGEEPESRMRSSTGTGVGPSRLTIWPCRASGGGLVSLT